VRNGIIPVAISNYNKSFKESIHFGNTMTIIKHSSPKSGSKYLLETMLGQRGGIIWFTGLSGSGKSTLSLLLAEKLSSAKQACYVLDGDTLRTGLCKDLGFSAKDRQENIRRSGAVAALFADAGIISIIALISPFIADRQLARALISPGYFVEVYLSTSLKICEERDPKGLYRKARSGHLPHFTGIDDPYEIPPSPDIRLDTENMSPQECVDLILLFMKENTLIL
jgi:adenylyl-sulfate kinase